VLLPFDYVRAGTREDAVNLAIEAGHTGSFLAGGTDLFVRMYDRQLRPKTLIDLKAIEGIEGIEHQNGEGLSIGAASPLNMLVRNKFIRSEYGLLAQAAHSVGSLQVRNRASIGGNICNASPAADTAPALLVYEAEIETWGPKSSRLIPISEFFTGPGKTVLEKGEFVYKIRLPKNDTQSYGVYLKLGRTDSVDLSIVSVACLAFASGEVRIALGAVAPTPIRAREAESVLLSSKDDEAIAQAASLAREMAVPISDIRAGEEYRLEMIEVMAGNAIRQALSGLAAIREVK
jgi:CO/xanthine dehydrogenase FAD-binding subunit